MRKTLISLLGTLAILGTSISTNSTYAQEVTPAPPKEKVERKDPFGLAIYNGTMSAVKHIGLHGGYKATPEPFKIVNETYRVPVYYDQGKVTMPKLEDVAENIEAGIDEAIPTAIERYGPIGNRPKGTKSNSEVTIDGTELTVEYDLQLPNERRTKTTEYLSKLEGMYKIAEFLTDSAKENPDKLNIEELERLARKHRLSVTAYAVEDNDPKIDTSLIAITHYNSKRPRVRWGNFNSGREKFSRSQPIDETFPKAYGFFHIFKAGNGNANPVPAPKPDGNGVPPPPQERQYIPRKTPVDKAPLPLDPSEEKPAPRPNDPLPKIAPPAPRRSPSAPPAPVA